jgi:hypothetical protein
LSESGCLAFNVLQDDGIGFEDISKAKGYGQLLPTLIGIEKFAGGVLVRPGEVLNLERAWPLG